MNRLYSRYGARSRVVDHAKCDNEPAFSDKQWTWLEISWLLLSVFGISHLQQQQNSFHNSAIYST